MATKVTLQITGKDQSGQNSKYSVTYINPTATNEQLTEFASKLEALSNDTTTNLKKITEEDI